VSAQGNISLHERALVELAQWMARAAQYSVAHPARKQFGEKTFATLTEALALESPLEIGVLKDDVLVGGVSARAPAIRTRLGPALHERGALVLRLLHGVTLQELSALVDILTLPATTVFDRGGLLRLGMDAQFARIQVEELAHDVTAEEREAQRRRSKLRSFFKEILLALLARRILDPRLAEHIVELLEHPEIAVMILEEDAAGLTDAVAGLALVVRQEEQRSGVPLAEKLRVVFLMLSPKSRARLLVGFPALVDEFRAAVAWVLDGFSEKEIARFAYPAIRENAADLEHVLYALSVAVPHGGTRLSALRWLGLTFFDLPADDQAGTEALRGLAKPTADYDSFHGEREALRELSQQALVARAPIARGVAQPAGAAAAAPFDARRSVAEVIGIATRTRSFDRFCEALPAAAETVLAEGSSDAVIGMLRGLSAVRSPPWQEHATLALNTVAATSAERVLADLDAASSSVEGEALEEIGSIVRLLAPTAPAMLLERLDQSENRKMRRMVLDALTLAGPTLMPLLRARLRSDQWFVVRNAVLLLGRVGASAHELGAVQRHPDERVRFEVVRALRTMPATEASMDLVVRYLTDPSAEVRQHAYPLLRGEILGDAAIADLERVAADDGQSAEVRRRVVEALGRCERDAAALALFKLLHPQGLIESSASSEMRDVAAYALRRSRAPAAPEYFERGLGSSVRRVRKACERAAGGGA
jgi:hypothetical protein